MNKLAAIFFLTGFLWGGANTVVGQNTDNKTKIGAYFSSFGVNEAFTFESLEGAGSYDSDNFLTLGVNYIHSLNKRIALETGLEYSKHKMKFNIPFTGENVSSTKGIDMKLISVPFLARVNFGNYIFANGGMLLDFDISKVNAVDKQTGMGAMLGIGAKYDFNSGLSAYINPYIKVHTLIPFDSKKWHQRVFETGIKLGVTYNL